MNSFMRLKVVRVLLASPWCRSSRPRVRAGCILTIVPLMLQICASPDNCCVSVPQEDDDIEEGDLPEHKRAPPPIDFSKVDPSKPEELLKLSKKGKTLMVFATVSGEPTEKETEEITGLWQGSLFNANFDIQRYEVNLLPTRRV